MLPFCPLSEEVSPLLGGKKYGKAQSLEIFCEVNELIMS